MIRARVKQGRVEVEEPIPEEWEGQSVKILPMTPDDPQPALEESLAALEALGPTEFKPGERELAARLLAEQNRISALDQFLVIARASSFRSAGPYPGRDELHERY